jgi:murein DD-endopeptidase MepM/ murein hydrolase activator NlpD
VKVIAIVAIVAALSILDHSPSSHPQVLINQPKTIVPVKGRWLRLPVIPDPNWKPGHRGLDIQANTEQMVFAPRSGTVKFADYIDGIGSVSIQTFDGYRHIVTFVEPTVEAQQKVRTGQQIGWVSEGGHCIRTCVHWAVKHNGVYIDPRWLLPSNLVRIKREGALG